MILLCKKYGPKDLHVASERTMISGLIEGSRDEEAEEEEEEE
jgi:hypothetical protein